MIKKLKIKNFAMVNDASIEFEDGFCIITGETGAGKSIIAEAIEFLLGEKPYAQLIKEGANFCEVEGEFESDKIKIRLPGMPANGKFSIRRVFDRNLKSKAFCCDNLISISALKYFGLAFSDFYGQDQARFLLEPDRQMDILDSYGGLEEERKKFEESYKIRNEISEKIKALSLSMEERDKLIDMYSFQIQEIEKLELNPAKDETLGERLARIKQKDKIARNISQCLTMLKDGENSSIYSVSKASDLLKEISSFDTSFMQDSEILEKISVELSAICDDLRSSMKEDEISVSEIDAMIERDEKIKKLKKRYGESIEEILNKAQELKEKVKLLEESSFNLSQLNKEFEKANEKMTAQAKKLSQKRINAAKKMSESVLKELKELGFEKASFKIDLSFQPEEIGHSGGDLIEYLFSANPDSIARPLRFCASGGELSRVALALKAVFAGAYNYDFSVFDEVDAGIGGNTAFLIGEKLRKISTKNQVIVITHAPQTASFANCHIKVEKKIKNGITEISFLKLPPREREKEIARMLGSKISPETAITHAREMLKISTSKRE